MRRLLVLRPEPGASATVGRARMLGFDVVAVPLFEVEPVCWEVPDPAGFDGLLLTSSNAVRHGGPQLQALLALPVFAVGEATAEAALQAGFKVIATGDSGIDGLLGSIELDARLLHLTGMDHREPHSAGHQIASIVVYRSKANDAPDLSAAPGSVSLIHSPRAGRRFAELVADQSSIAIVAISQAAADAVGSGWESIAVADMPTDEALLATAAVLCNKPAPQ
jgi:uroporphyrinogen-III synthase